MKRFRFRPVATPSKNAFQPLHVLLFRVTCNAWFLSQLAMFWHPSNILCVHFVDADSLVGVAQMVPGMLVMTTYKLVIIPHSTQRGANSTSATKGSMANTGADERYLPFGHLPKEYVQVRLEGRSERVFEFLRARNDAVMMTREMDYRSFDLVPFLVGCPVSGMISVSSQ